MQGRVSLARSWKSELICNILQEKVSVANILQDYLSFGQVKVEIQIWISKRKKTQMHMPKDRTNCYCHFFTKNLQSNISCVKFQLSIVRL